MVTTLISKPSNSPAFQSHTERWLLLTWHPSKKMISKDLCWSRILRSTTIIMRVWLVRAISTKRRRSNDYVFFFKINHYIVAVKFYYLSIYPEWLTTCRPDVKAALPTQKSLIKEHHGKLSKIKERKRILKRLLSWKTQMHLVVKSMAIFWDRTHHRPKKQVQVKSIRGSILR